MKPWERLLLFSLLFSIQAKAGNSESLLANINDVLSSLMGLLLAIGAALVAFRSSNTELRGGGDGVPGTPSS